MIQDIEPYQFNNQYEKREPLESDMFLSFCKNKVLANTSDLANPLPTFTDLGEDCADYMVGAIYLFSVDDHPIFLVSKLASIPNSRNIEEAPHGFAFVDIHKLYHADEKWVSLAVATGLHLNTWYNDTQHCGRCGKTMAHHSVLRAMKCQCNNIQFPRISPVVLAAIVKDGRIVATRYRDRPYKGLALNAGFVEIGESLEEALRREVGEEVGLKVRDVHYFASQPWGHTEIVMAGFFVEIEGDDTLTIDENELSEAMWMSREELPPQTDPMSLTARMFEAFRLREVEY